jgi:diguanylate cyclase (GGDEF)-like protein
MWLLSDISELKSYQQRIERLAFHDSLTGLPNRLLFSDRLAQALAIASRNKSFLAVCYVDLDGFKPVNDVHGHAAGDGVLKEIARRMQHFLRPSDTACRLGGDEFVLLLTHLESPDAYRHVLDRAMLALTKPIAISSNKTVTLGASVGVAHFPIDGEDMETLLRNADKAMYQAKASGKNCVVVYAN